MKNMIPKIFTWVLGLIFTFMIPFTIFEVIFKLEFLQFLSVNNPKNNGSVAVVVAMIFYVWISMNINNTKDSNRIW